MQNNNEVRQLSVAFQSGTNYLTAVDDVSFTLYPGETMALLGESGCGKSLTSLAIMRLLPQECVYGQLSKVRFQSQDLLELPERVMRTLRGKRIAMIFQEPMTALNPVLTVGQQLYEALRQHHALGKKALHDKAVALLKEVELPNAEKRLSQYPHQLSGGQKQRVVIAMALACDPDLLIADEPTTALDVTIQAQILALLKKLQVRYQMSLMLITHDLSVVKATANRVCVMYAGQIVETADVRDFFEKPLHPYSQQLLMSIPAIEKRGQRLHTIQGSVPSLDAKPKGCRFHPRCPHRFQPCDQMTPSLEPVNKPLSEQTSVESQKSSHERMVRCYLYPKHERPPEIPVTRETWTRGEMSEEALLTVKDLKVYFTSGSRFLKNQTTFKAVDGLSFQLNRGKTLALVGESGCGKTTTARAIVRLQSITAGQLVYQNEEVSKLRGRRLRNYRKRVQIIFQDPFSSMNPRMTVADILAEGMRAQGFSTREVQSRQQALLDQVNLPKSSLSRYPHQFSGGQRQRICIARALATEPELLICDEPTSALDISVQAQILNLLKDLQQAYQLSYLFITHNMAVVSYIADNVLVMKAGQAVEFGCAEDIFTNPQAEYTKKLLASVLPA